MISDKESPALAGVSLEQLLAAKECRAARQQEWLTRYQHPIISLTLVTPGAIKDSPRYRQCMQTAITLCHQLLQAQQWQVLDHQVLWLPTGPEGLWSIAHAATDIKTACVALERTHPLGRLWDLDVICHQSGQIGRRALGEPLRQCLICDEPAHGCARSRRHPLPEIVRRIEDLIDDCFTHP